MRRKGEETRGGEEGKKEREGGREGREVVTSHLRENCTCSMVLDAVPHPPVGDWG